jgi:eukaryotic-like serine/threonine-protein kinase
VSGGAEHIAVDETLPSGSAPRSDGDSDPRLAAELEQARGVERQELVSDVRRYRLMLVFGVVAWSAFGAIDYIVMSYVEPGSVAWFWTLRALGLVPVAVCGGRIWMEPIPSRRLFTVLDLCIVFSLVAFVGGMAVEYRGIHSSYAAGAILVLVVRGAVLASPWRRALVLVGVPALAYPLVLVVAAAFSDEIAAQFRDATALAGFAEHASFLVCAVLALTWGSHATWSIRRQAFEARSVGRYRLERRIGRGGMGEVWAAYHRGLRRNVALKTLRPDKHSSTVDVARFEREVQATTQLTHPNTVRIFDYGVTEDGIWYYAMELLEGRNLAELVRAEGPLPPARAVHLLSQAARALAEAHRHGIVHRDIKPENIFITTAGGEEDFVKVLDFGIAKLTADDGSLTLTSGDWIGGTPAYMSPEAARGQAADARADIYSLGAVLYFAASGQPPFAADNVAAMMSAHISETPRPPSEALGTPLPADLEQLILRCLDKDPAGRHPDAGALAADLARCADVAPPP